MNLDDMPAVMRIPPAAVESEQVVIGSLLLDNGAFDRISERLRSDHFFRHENRLIFAEIARQLGAGKHCDVVTVFQSLTGEGVEIGYLNQLAQYVASSANLVRHAEIVIERAKSRDLVRVAAEIDTLAFASHQTIDERIESAQGQLAKLIEDAPRDEWIGAYEGMMHHAAVLEDRAEGRVRSWETGLSDLDEYLEGGLRPGGLYIIGARPSMGKTALGMTVGLHMAQDYSVGMLSMEMPHRELRDRMTAMLGRVPLSTVIRPTKGDGLEWGRVLEGTDTAKRLNFRVSDQGGLNINQVRAKARNLKRLHGLNVLIVDYIGLMSGLDAKQPRAYQLEEISRGLKTLAKELDIAVVCLAQVNRKVEERADATPALSDLRDSGAIEQDADVVMFVHRPIQSKPDLGDEWTHYAKLSVAKNRQGRCGYLSLFYQGDQTRFDNWGGESPRMVKATPSRRGFVASRDDDDGRF